MLMTSFLENRKSTRDFRDKEVSLDLIRKIEEEIKEVNKLAEADGVEFRLYERGKDIYSGFKNKAGYSGVMIESPLYLALLTAEDDRSKLTGAYYMEQLISVINKLDLATCWVTVADVSEEDKGEILGAGQRKVDYLLAIGYQKRRNPFEKEVVSERKPVEEIVFKDEIGKAIDNDELENRGLMDLFYYIRYAPSTKNLQPWRFVVKENKVVLYMEKENYSLTDAGIIMYYFEGLASLIGINNHWSLVDGEDGDYIRLAEIEI